MTLSHTMTLMILSSVCNVSPVSEFSRPVMKSRAISTMPWLTSFPRHRSNSICMQQLSESSMRRECQCAWLMATVWCRWASEKPELQRQMLHQWLSDMKLDDAATLYTYICRCEAGLVHGLRSAGHCIELSAACLGTAHSNAVQQHCLQSLCNWHQTCLAHDLAGAVLLRTAAVLPSLLDGVLKQDMEIVSQLPR